jgi:multidrug resistance efflux pump
MPDTDDRVAAAEADDAAADDKVKQAEVELLAARRGSDQSAIDDADANLKQAEVELLAAREKVKAARGG